MRSLLKQHKKYDIMTIIIVVITLTVLALGALVLSSFMGDFGNDIKDVADDMATDGFINQTNADYATDFIANDTESFADNYVFWFFVATFIGLMLTALYLEFEPAVMIIIFIFGAIAILGAWLGAEIYSEFGTDLPTANTAMGKTAILMSSPYFPIFIFLGLIVMMVIMYNKKRSGEYQ